MKKIKIIALILALALCMQIGVCASNTDATSNDFVKITQIQPRGRYLLGGSSTIAPYTGYIKVTGITEAYEDVDSLKVELTVYRIESSGSWTEVWSTIKTATDDFEVSYPSTRINVASGYYYVVQGTHTVTHNGITETNYSEPAPVYVY